MFEGSSVSSDVMRAFPGRGSAEDKSSLAACIIFEHKLLRKGTHARDGDV
jgi:hypothetical protein